MRHRHLLSGIKAKIQNHPHVMANVLARLKERQRLQRLNKQKGEQAEAENEANETDYHEVYRSEAPLPESTGLGSLATINEVQADTFNEGDESFGGRWRAKRKEHTAIKNDKHRAKNELIRAKAAKKLAKGEAAKTKANNGNGGKVLDTINSVATGLLSKGGGNDSEGGNASAESLEVAKPNYLLWGGIGLAVLIALIIAVKMMTKK